MRCLDPKSVQVGFALDVLEVADQFLTDALKQLCEVAIHRAIRVENVAMMLRTADERNVVGLRKRCFDYIMLHFGKIIGTSAFAELPPELLHEVLNAASRRGAYLRT